MFIKNLCFENYRNLKNSSLSPAENINIIYGNNAQGKTNLIECMWLLTGGRSFRGAKDRELIAFDQEFARVKASFFSTSREQTVEILIQHNKRTPFLNGVQKNYLSEIIGSFCAVIFSPNHLTLVKNGPDERRNFIDSALCQIKPSYAMFLSRYRKILNQRNALLKAIPPNSIREYPTIPKVLKLPAVQAITPLPICPVRKSNTVFSIPSAVNRKKKSASATPSRVFTVMI